MNFYEFDQLLEERRMIISILEENGYNPNDYNIEMLLEVERKQPGFWRRAAGLGALGLASILPTAKLAQDIRPTDVPTGIEAPSHFPGSFQGHYATPGTQQQFAKDVAALDQGQSTENWEVMPETEVSSLQELFNSSLQKGGDTTMKDMFIEITQAKVTSTGETELIIDVHTESGIAAENLPDAKKRMEVIAGQILQSKGFSTKGMDWIDAQTPAQYGPSVQSVASQMQMPQADHTTWKNRGDLLQEANGRQKIGTLKILATRQQQAPQQMAPTTYMTPQQKAQQFGMQQTLGR